MKSAEIYALPVVWEEPDLHRLSDSLQWLNLWVIPDEASGRVRVRNHADFSFDGNRCWTLASVWFDETPVMVLQRAGRGGRDFHRDYITNGAKYGEMLVHLLSLTLQHDSALQVSGPDDDIPVEFYRCTYEQIITMQAERAAVLAAKLATTEVRDA